jgi:hypothetical protein
MMPTVSQQLDSLLTTMNRVIIPALPAEDAFVQEQGQLISAMLSWLLDVHESEHHYEAVENAEYHALLGALRKIQGAEHSPQAPEIDQALVEPTATTVGDLAELRARTRRLKELATAFLASSGDIGPEARRTARRLVMGVAERQAAREQSWYRSAGFIAHQPADIATVLAEQEGAHR